jgi:hypothetical protein
VHRAAPTLLARHAAKAYGWTLLIWASVLPTAPCIILNDRLVRRCPEGRAHRLSLWQSVWSPGRNLGYIRSLQMASIGYGCAAASPDQLGPALLYAGALVGPLSRTMGELGLHARPVIANAGPAIV